MKLGELVEDRLSEVMRDMTVVGALCLLSYLHAAKGNGRFHICFSHKIMFLPKLTSYLNLKISSYVPTVACMQHINVKRLVDYMIFYKIYCGKSMQLNIFSSFHHIWNVFN